MGTCLLEIVVLVIVILLAFLEVGELVVVILLDCDCFALSEVIVHVLCFSVVLKITIYQ